MNKLEFDERDDDAWICNTYHVSPARANVCVTLSAKDRPTPEYVAKAVSVLSDIEPLILSASGLILDNYSYEHFKKLGVDESLLLKEENAEAMSRVVTLLSAWFLDPGCEEFELSFSVPWDLHHVFSVEFDGGEAICCAVNG